MDRQHEEVREVERLIGEHRWIPRQLPILLAETNFACSARNSTI